MKQLMIEKTEQTQIAKEPVAFPPFQVPEGKRKELIDIMSALFAAPSEQIKTDFKIETGKSVQLIMVRCPYCGKILKALPCQTERDARILGYLLNCCDEHPKEECCDHCGEASSIFEQYFCPNCPSKDTGCEWCWKAITNPDFFKTDESMSPKSAKQNMQKSEASVSSENAKAHEKPKQGKTKCSKSTKTKKYPKQTKIPARVRFSGSCFSFS